MNGTASKEQKRNLRKLLGEEIAAVIETQQQLVQSSLNGQRVLARQMLELETTIAKVREARAIDQRQAGAKLDELKDQHALLIGRAQDALARLIQLEDWARRRQQLTRWQRFWSFVTGRCAVEL